MTRPALIALALLLTAAGLAALDADEAAARPETTIRETRKP